jgi:hypothetical protein
MKHILKTTLLFFVAGLFFSSCAKKEQTLLNAGTAPIIGNTPASIVIDKTNINSGTVTISFKPATYSTAVAITSQFEIGVKGTNFSPAVALGNAIVGNEDVSSEFTYKQLNAAFTELRLTPSQKVDIEIRLKTYASAYQQSNEGLMPSYSEVKTIAVTPFEPQPAWVYAVGEFQGWNREGNYGIVSLLDNGTYITYINFPNANSAFLILPDNSSSWDHKWGSDDGIHLIKDGGADIKSPGAGWYRVTVNLTDLTISMKEFGSVGVVGTINNWGDNPDIPTVYNPQEHRFEATITSAAGNDEIKFRLNSAWDTNWGGKDGVAWLGGDNIQIAAAGTYLVTIDFTDPDNLTYTITKK